MCSSVPHIAPKWCSPSTRQAISGTKQDKKRTQRGSNQARGGGTCWDTEPSKGRRDLLGHRTKQGALTSHHRGGVRWEEPQGGTCKDTESKQLRKGRDLLGHRTEHWQGAFTSHHRGGVRTWKGSEWAKLGKITERVGTHWGCRSWFHFNVMAMLLLILVKAWAEGKGGGKRKDGQCVMCWSLHVIISCFFFQSPTFFSKLTMPMQLHCRPSHNMCLLLCLPYGLILSAIIVCTRWSCKLSARYDATNLFINTEGTLSIVPEVTICIALYPPPPQPTSHRMHQNHQHNVHVCYHVSRQPHIIFPLHQHSPEHKCPSVNCMSSLVLLLSIGSQTKQNYKVFK